MRGVKSLHKTTPWVPGPDPRLSPLRVLSPFSSPRSHSSFFAPDRPNSSQWSNDFGPSFGVQMLPVISSGAEHLLSLMDELALRTQMETGLESQLEKRIAEVKTEAEVLADTISVRDAELCHSEDGHGSGWAFADPRVRLWSTQGADCMKLVHLAARRDMLQTRVVEMRKRLNEEQHDRIWRARQVLDGMYEALKDLCEDSNQKAEMGYCHFP